MCSLSFLFVLCFATNGNILGIKRCILAGRGQRQATTGISVHRTCAVLPLVSSSNILIYVYTIIQNCIYVDRVML